MTADDDLLDAWRDGDRGAGADLFARHFPAVYDFFRTKLPHAAEDLTQQTFLRCVEARDSLHRASGLRAYLFAIARNLLFDHLRWSGRRPEAPDFELASIADLDPSAGALLVFREEQKLLVHALRRLPVDLQIAVELYFVQRLQGAELAIVLGIPTGTVRSRIRRAIERLREVIAELAASPQHIRTTLTDLQRWAHEVRSAPAGR